jgi:hypothetical protein
LFSGEVRYGRSEQVFLGRRSRSFEQLFFATRQM